MTSADLPPKENSDEVFNLAKVLERVDGDREFLGTLAGVFVADCPRRLESLRRAVSEGNTTEWRRAAHTLKGSVAAFDANPAFEAAQRMEMMDDRQPAPAIADALQQLECEINRLMLAIRQLVLEKKS